MTEDLCAGLPAFSSLDAVTEQSVEFARLNEAEAFRGRGWVRQQNSAMVGWMMSILAFNLEQSR